MGNYCASQKDNLDIDTTAKIKAGKLAYKNANSFFAELFQQMEGGKISDDFPKYQDIHIIRAVQSATVKRVLREPIDTTGATKGGRKDGPDFMNTLIRANWPYTIISEDGSYNEPVNAIDCLIIYQRLKKIRQGQEKDPMVLLPLENFEVNVNDNSAIKDFNPNEKYKLVKNKNNIRARSTECAKNYDEMFDLSNIDDDELPDEEYALLYYRMVKKRDEKDYPDVWYNDPKGFPSIKEVVIGLWELQCEKLDDALKNAPSNLKKEIKDSNKWAFMFMIMCIDFDDIERPLTKEDFVDPKGKVVSLIMYLNTIEPPFYAELNTACRTLDTKKLKMLGPFARCVYQILATRIENSKKDKIERGDNFSLDEKSLGYFKKNFLLYRGSKLKARWINDWTRQVIIETSSGSANNIKIRGNFSATSSMQVALNQARSKNVFEKPVLFVISVRNYRGFAGFRLDQPQYSAHPHEQEYLLQDGIRMFVLKVEEVPMETTQKDFDDWKGKFITVIHLYYNS